MKVYFDNKLGITSTVKLGKNNMVDQFDRELQHYGGIEKVRVNMITSPCMWYISD